MGKITSLIDKGNPKGRIVTTDAIIKNFGIFLFNKYLRGNIVAEVKNRIKITLEIVDLVIKQ